MGAKSDVVVKLVLVFFISLLSFAIGTFVGKKYSDNQHKLAKLEPQTKEAHGERAVASEHGEEQATTAKHEEKSEMVSDEEIKKLTEENLKKEEFVADDTKTAAAAHGAKEEHGAKKEERATAKTEEHGAAKKEEHAVVKAEPVKAEHGKTEHAVEKTSAAEKAKPKAHTTKNEAVHDEALAAAQAFLDGKAPEAKEEVKKETRIPSSLPKDVAQYAVGKFTVQVASYAEKVDAEKKASKLKEMGYQANVFSAQVSGKTWYRVSFGLFATQDEAVTEKQKYLEKNKTESALVQKIKN
jgi:cell division protein FtsN